MAIADWPEAERPRERLIAQGAQALSDAELLAIFLRVGVKGKSAVDLARDLLAAFDGRLSRLATAPADTLTRLPGMGPAKAVQLAASLELARRALRDDLTGRDLLNTPTAVRDWLKLRLADLPHEVFGVIWLDPQNRFIDYDELFRGTLTETSVYPREIVKQALARNAAAVLLVHNHPSGHGEPSPADRRLTEALRAALNLVDVRVLDHLIIAGRGTPYSFAEQGLL